MQQTDQYYRERENHYVDKARTDLKWVCGKFYKIKDKSGKIVPFVWNDSQIYFDSIIEKQLKETGYVRVLALKGRQQGISTYTEARYYNKTSLNKGKKAFILTHESDATDNIFEITKRFHDYDSPLTKQVLKHSNAKELVFDGMDSQFAVSTAKTKETGRGGTNQLVHGSEVAFWLNAASHMKALMQTVPSGELKKGTEVILESTANGVGNHFHKMWQDAVAGRSDYIAVFIPWFWQREYREEVPDDFKLTEDERTYKEKYKIEDSQVLFMRQKIYTDFGGNQEDFDMEYPADADRAFAITGMLSFIKPKDVAKARQNHVVQRTQPKFMGVDVARFGDDRTVFILRQNRKVHPPLIYENIDLMETAGKIAIALRDGICDRVFLDVVGIGAGVYDRLVELNYSEQIVPVCGAEKPIEEAKYANKRAECWGNMREWLTSNLAVDLPDDDALQSDLITPQYKFKSDKTLLMESKPDIKKRGFRSPDLGDALALTFAEPYSGDFNKELDYSKVCDVL